jgi:hypothetical protein
MKENDICFYKGQRVQVVALGSDGMACITRGANLLLVPQKELITEEHMGKVTDAYEILATDIGVPVDIIKECLAGIKSATPYVDHIIQLKKAFKSM